MYLSNPRTRLACAIISGGLLIAGYLSIRHGASTDTAKAAPGAEPPGKASPHAPAADPRLAEATESKPRQIETGSSRSRQDARGADAIERFSEWTDRYAKATTPQERAALVKEGVELAKLRRPAFLELITTDPERALQQAVPMVVRQDLPPEIVAQLEERVSAHGQLKTYQSTPLAGQDAPPAAVRYLVTDDGKTYQAHTFGREEFLVQWKDNRSANGVGLKPEGGGIPQLALSPSPIRRLEDGERPDPAKPAIGVCPVSGKTSAPPADSAGKPIAASTPAVEANGTIVYLCNGSHTVIYEDQLVQQETALQGEGSTGGAQPFSGYLPHATTKSLGVLKVLYIPVTFPDENTPPTNEATAYATMKDIGDYFTASSFGKLTIATTVTPCVMMPHTAAWYKAKDQVELDCLGLTHNDARAGAKALGYDPANFDTIIVLQTYAGVSRGAGGWGGGNSVWIYDPNWRGVVAHEMGHTFGLAHANFWNTGGISAIGSGSSQEYGDDYDAMGGAGFPNPQYNIKAKEQISWLKTADNLTTVTESGTYRVYAHDANTLEPARRYGLKVVKDTQRTYYAEVRQLWDSDVNQPWLKNGIQLEWGWPNKAGNNLLIDTTPGTINGKADGNIVVGRTFSDYEAGIHFTPVAVNFGPQKSVDVVVNIGQFPANQAPTLTLNASTSIYANTMNVPVGATVTCNAAASDPDGDALAYYWSYGNGDKTVLPNSPSITRAFSTAGQYWVGCTVSDMKGKTAARYVAVNVGTPSTFSIGGRVTNAGLPMANVLVNGPSGKEVFTDSDGYYSIVGLSAGYYSITPNREGFTFAGSLPSAIAVGPSVANADFAATSGTTLSIAASVPNCAEGNATPGKFTFSRTGATTNALTVQVQTISGSATKTTDYTLSPDVVSNTFTIPAGQASLDVSVTPVNDTSAEGPETVRMLLLPDASYVITGMGEATVTIDDNDTTLPKVSIVANKPVTVENDPQPAQFTVTRTGSTATTLTVNYTASGTATSGADYVALPGSVTIPIGATSAAISLTTINDNVSESNETVTVTLASSANYLIDPAATIGTATIVDDDVQVVSVATSDAVATEGATPPDTGTFVVSRTGDTAQALTVYYGFSGSALHGADYETMPGYVTILAGQTSAAVTIVPIDDGIGEGSETVTLLLASLGSNYKLGSVSTSTLTINDNASGLPTVEVASVDTSCSEPSDAGKFRFIATGGSGTAFTINYVVSGTATPGTDYTALSGTVSIPAGAGARTVDVTVTPINDSLLEDLENIVVTISTSPNYQVWEPKKTAAMWLRDDDQPTVFVDAQSTVPTEAGTASKFYISRVGSTTNALDVNYTMSGTATNGVDYNALSGLATIPAGASGVDVIVTPINDTIAEGTETITMSLAPGAYSRSPVNATLYLQDNETVTTQVAFNSPVSNAAENAGTVNIPVSLSAASTGTVTVDYAVSSGNLSSVSNATSGIVAPYWVRLVRSGDTLTAYRSTNGSTWTQQGTPQTVGLGNPVLAGLAVTSHNDGTLCTGVFDNVTITPAGGSFTGRDIGAVSAPGSDSQNAGTYTVQGSGADIWDTADEFHYVYQQISGDCTITARVASVTNTNGWAKAGVMIREGTAANARNAFMCVSAANGTSFQWRSGSTTTATGSGVDFTLASGSLTFAPGELTHYISVAIIDDIYTEPNEKVVIALLNPTNASFGANSQHTLTIVDNDAPAAVPFVGFAAQAASDLESVSPANIVVSLSDPTATAVTVNYAVTGGTAVNGTDYTLTNGTLSFAPGETTKVIPNTIIDDATVEPDRTIVIGLSAPTGAALGANTTHTYTILNDDTPTVNITATDATASELGTDGGTFTVARTGPTTSALTVNFAVSGTATSGADYTSIGTSVTIPAGQASQTIAVTPINDSIGEPAETVIATISTNAAYTIGAANTATVSISDDDLPIVNITATDGVASEPGSDTGTLTVTRTGSTTSSLTVNFTVSGTATSGTDYTSIGTSVTIPAGQSSQTIQIVPIDDLVSEGQEFVLVTLASSANYGIGSSGYASVVINENDFAPTVQIIEPVSPSAVLSPGSGLILQANAADDGTPGPLTVTWSKVNGPGTVTFGTPGATSTTATFSANGTYLLRITASDGAQSATDDVAVSVGGADALASQDIGTSVSFGSYGESAGTHTITVRSGDIWNSADSFRYAFEQAVGDVTVTARVVSETNTAGWVKAGVMIRETTLPGSAHAMMCITPSNGAAFQYRTSTNGGSSNSNTAGFVAPYWVRAVRSGDTFTGYRSPDGVTWTQQASATITMSNTVLVGLSLCANNTGSTCTATFDNFSVTPAVNKGAIVSAGADQNIGTSTASLAGTVTDDSQPTPPGTVSTTWSQVSGPGAATFANASAPSTTVTLPVSGNYVLRLTADDGWVTIYDEIAIHRNGAPVAVNDSATILEDSAASVAVLANDSDPDGDPLGIQSVTQGTHGVVTIAGTNASYTPAANWNGVDSFSYTITDGNGGTATANVSVTVTPVNDPPVATNDSATTAEDTGVSIAVLANDSDVDGGALSIQSVTQGAHGSVAIAGTNVTYTPAANWNGTDSFSYTASDGNGGTATAGVTVTVSAVNDAPAFSANPLTQPDAIAGQAYAGTLAGSATDVDAGDTLSYSKVGGPAWLSMAADGSLSGAPAIGDSGANAFTVRVTDASGLFADATLQINVVVMNGNGTWTNASGGSWTNNANWSGGIIANGANNIADFSTLNLSADATVTLDGARTIGNLVFADTGPSNNWNLNPGTGGALTLDVGSGVPSIAVTNQSTTIRTVLAGTKGVSTSGGGTLTLAAVNTFTGGLTVQGGLVKLQAGSYQRVIDPASVITINGGTVDTVDVNSVYNNDITVNAGGTMKFSAYHAHPRNVTLAGGALASSGSGKYNGDDFQLDGNLTVNGSAASAINLGNGFSSKASPVIDVADVTGDANPDLTISGAGTIHNPDSGTTSLNKTGAGTLVLANANTYTGATSINAGTLRVDGSLGASAMTVQSSATLAGGGAISGPVSVQSGGTLAPGANGIGTLTINNTLILAGSVTMEISRSGATLTSGRVGGITTATFGGALVVTNAGPDALVGGNAFQLFSAGSYAGAFTTVTLPTLTAGLVWDTSTLAVDGTIRIRSLPVAVADTSTTAEDTSTIIAVLANDSDADGDTLSIESVTQGANGTVATDGASVTYTPAANWNGSDSFSYTINDGRDGTATATVTVTVTSVNDVPVFAVNPINRANATQGFAYSATIGGTASDVDAGDTLTYSKVGGPVWLNVAANGSLSGTPSSTDVGGNAWTVRVTDSQGATADATLNITVVAPALPSGWTAGDIGSVGLVGSTSENNGTFTVSGSGADIWGTADAFQFASQTLNGDGEIRARVTSQTNTSPWAKAGVMIRETTAANSRHAMLVVTPGNGFALQYRSATAGASTSVAGPALNTAPNNWVRLTRSGSLITAYASADGATWTQVGTVAIAMNASVSAGLAVTSTNNSAISTATFDNVGVTPFPPPWLTVDIGATGLQGSAEYYNAAYTVKGAGNVSGSADNFRFVYQALSGDGEIRARINAPGNTGTSARLGVMIRDTLTSGSEYAFMGVNGSSAYYWQRRSATGGTTSSTASGSGTAPNLWVRVVRSGNTLYGYKSSDGVTWTLVNSRNITMGTNIYIGLVDASGSTTTLNSTIFGNVTVTP